MFCTNCGKENAPNMNFCTSCGTSIQNTAQEQVAPQPATPTSTTEASHGGYFVAPETPASPYAPVSPTARTTTTRTLAILLAVITIIGLLLSGPVLKIPLSDLEDEIFGVDIKLADINIPIPMFSYAQGAGQFGNRINSVKKAIKREARDNEFVEAMMEETNEQMAPILSAIGWMSFIRILTIAALIFLLLFVYFASDGKKNAALFGQVGNILALISSIGVLILSIVASASLNELGEDIPVSIGPAFWTFAVLIIGIISLCFITMRKDVLNK